VEAALKELVSEAPTGATPAKVRIRPAAVFLLGIFLISGATLQYEVVLTRLMSVVSWYYLAFVSVSMAMFGMTAGALAVQLREEFFAEELYGRRLAQAALAMGISLPLSMLTMFAIPLSEITSLQELYVLLLFTSVISVPFFFAGVVVCLALTRSQYPIGRVYAVDLVGAAAGCLGAIGLMKIIDAPSAVLAVAAVVCGSAALFAYWAGDRRLLRTGTLLTLAMVALVSINATSQNPVRPVWSRTGIDKRSHVEMWNAISRVRLYPAVVDQPFMWGASPNTPKLAAEWMWLDIDSDAATSILRYPGDANRLRFLNYDVTSLAYQIRHGGSAAVIGIGGGRDLMTAWTNGFQRIVGVEINPSLVELAHKLRNYNGLAYIPAVEIHQDEGRSYLTRTTEKFDVIQASMVDTWAAASAGSMSLTENSLYTVEGWKIFYEHLKPGGILTMTRWSMGVEASQTERMFAVAWATLLEEGAENPAEHIALVGSGAVATILLSNRPLTFEDRAHLKNICSAMEFKILFLNGEATPPAAFAAIAATRKLGQLQRITTSGSLDISPPYDRSPFFFNSLRLSSLWSARATVVGGNLLALRFLLGYMLVAVLLLALLVFWPLTRWNRSTLSSFNWKSGGIVYFVSIGMGFMLAEMAMIEQQSLLLGHPIYSLAVVLAGLILSTGIGSLVSEQFRIPSWRTCRGLALGAAVVVVAYALTVLPLIHMAAGGSLWKRIALTLALLFPCGFLMGFCFPLGMRILRGAGSEGTLPWMWALNGAASVVAAFLAVLLSMETSTVDCALAGAGCYAIAALLPPRS
jgi:predicted membrane-bound spermidine synthase